jgi:hypothetical protein
MADKVDPQVIDALTIGNVKTVGESASFAMASLFQHQVNHARRTDSIAEAHLGKVLNSFASIDPVEAVATAKLFKGEADSGISSLLAQLASGQIGAKVAQSTPGDISVQIAQMGASVASLQGTIGGLVAMLQQAMKGAQTTPPITHG